MFDKNGSMTCFFSGPILVKDSLEAEIVAIDFAIAFQVTNPFSHSCISICSDSKQDILLVKQKLIMAPRQNLEFCFVFVSRKYNE